MYVRFRPTRVADLDACGKYVRDAFAYSEEERGQLVRLWRETIESGACNAAVIEDATSPPDRQILWCCFMVFVRREYADRLIAMSTPFVAKQVLRDCSLGNSPILSLEEIRTANSTKGLNALVLNSGAPDYVQTPDLLPLVSSKMVDFTLYHVSGYRLNEFLVESYTPMTSTWVAGSGLLLRRDRSEDSTQPEYGLSPEKPHRRLYGVNSIEASDRPGSVMSSIFHYRPPVFGFTGLEQQLLLYALTDDTYEALAEALSLAKVTISKRWQSIYDKVGASPLVGELLPGFVQDGKAHSDSPDQQYTGAAPRGAERKRFLLNYIRHHMEEVRPIREPLTPRAIHRPPYIPV